MATGIELIISSICNATFCESVYDNPLIDACFTNKKLELQTLAHEVNGKHLKVGTYNNIPLSWTELDANGTLTGHGVAFTILKMLQTKFNFTYELVIPERNMLTGGSKAEDSLIGLVSSHKVDMVAALVPTLLRYRKMVSFSVPLDEAVYMMMLRRPKESATGSGLLAPFKGHVWYLILVAVLSYGPCITIMTRLRCKLVRDNEKHIPLPPSIWFVYGSFIKQGTTLSPEANTTRVLFATWWLFIILLSAFYTANLTAFLTLSKFTLDIQSPQDLLTKNYRWISSEGGTVQYVVHNPSEDLFYLSKMVANGRAEFRSVTSNTEFLPFVDQGAVLVKEQTVIDHLMYGDYLTKVRDGVPEINRCTYVVAPKPFMKKLRAFVFPKNSTLHKLFEPVLASIVEAGIIPFLEHLELPSTKICPMDLQSKERQLLNSDLMMTYMLMIVGTSAAVAVFIGEVVIKRYFKIRFKRDPNSKKLKKNKKVRIRNYDDSHPPPYDSLFGGNSSYRITENSQRRIINGTEYWMVEINGDTRLIPVRSSSALLYQ